ncbi:MAG: hypothetical protein AAF915_23040 [Cyanobacteria bacterium P01_D01_bin.50]
MSMMQVLEKSAIVFSQNFLPLYRVNTKRAVVCSPNRTPKEAGMQLRKKPQAPVHQTIYFAEQFWKGVVQANLE